MKVLECYNVNDALYNGLSHLALHGARHSSRNGEVLVAPGPVCTVYRHPQQRVLFSPLRDANPFFHFLESMWMLAGRNDVAFPARYATQMSAYTDDGVTLNGAYGHRWRVYFGYDQLRIIIDELRANPQSRRCVLSMWDGGAPGADERTQDFGGDLHKAASGSRDVPCNTHAYFDAASGVLNMTVCCRSNDAIWGAHGANAVHFSVLQEYAAAAAGLPVGVLYQFSNNYHVYIGRPDVDRLLSAEEGGRVSLPHGYNDDRYLGGDVRATPLFSDVAVFDQQLARLMAGWNAGVPAAAVFAMGSENIEPAVNTASNMISAHTCYKAGDFYGASVFVAKIQHTDWRLACEQWLQRRQEKRNVNAA